MEAAPFPVEEVLMPAGAGTEAEAPAPAPAPAPVFVPVPVPAPGPAPMGSRDGPEFACIDVAAPAGTLLAPLDTSDRYAASCAEGCPLTVGLRCNAGVVLCVIEETVADRGFVLFMFMFMFIVIEDSFVTGNSSGISISIGVGNTDELPAPGMFVLKFVWSMDNAGVL